MSINLKNCIKGIELVTRNGELAFYGGHYVQHGLVEHPHIIKHKYGAYYVNDKGFCVRSKGKAYLDIVAFAVIRLDDADIFSTLPEGITEVVYKGERYKKQVKTTWVKA